MAPAAGALHNFLPDVAALVEAERVQKARFEGDHVFTQFRPITRNAGLDAQTLQRLPATGEHVVSRRLATRCAPDGLHPRGIHPHFVAFLARARGANHANGEARVIRGKVVKLLHRRQVDVQRLLQQSTRPRPLERQRVKFERLDFHLVGNNEAAKTLDGLLAQVSLGIDQEAVLSAVQAQIHHDVPLRVKERGVRALTGRELLDVIAHKALEQPRVVAAFHAEFGAERKVEKPGGGAHGAVLRRGIGETRGNDRAVIFRERGALGTVIFSERRSEHW